MYTFENFLKKNRIFSSQSTNRLLSTCLGCWTVLYGKVLNGNGFVCLFVWMRSSWGDEWICIKLSSVLCSALALAVGVDSILFSAVQFNLGRKRRLNVILYFSYSLNWTRRVGWKRKILQRLSRKYGTRVNSGEQWIIKKKTTILFSSQTQMPWDVVVSSSSSISIASYTHVTYHIPHD